MTRRRLKRSASCPPLGPRRSKRNGQSNLNTLASQILSSYYQSTLSPSTFLSNKINSRNSTANENIRNVRKQSKKKTTSKEHADGTTSRTGRTRRNPSDSPSSSTATTTPTTSTTTTNNNKNTILFITGAGLSVPSGVRPFRGKDGLWNQVLWTKATRESFRDDPLSWYNDFWLRFFTPEHNNTIIGENNNNNNGVHNCHYRPNDGHEALALLCAKFPNIKVITQNIDGLASQTKTKWDASNQLIECHGRLGLFKCIPEEDSDTSEDETDDDDNNNNDNDNDNDNDDDEFDSTSSDEDEDDNQGIPFPRRKQKRDVKLGSIRKQQQWRRKYQKYQSSITTTPSTTMPWLRNRRGSQFSNKHQQKPTSLGPCPCRYEMEDSIRLEDILPIETRRILSGENTNTDEVVEDSDYDDDLNTDFASMTSSTSSSPMRRISSVSSNTSSESSGEYSSTSTTTPSKPSSSTKRKSLSDTESSPMKKKRPYKRKSKKSSSKEDTLSKTPRLRSPPMCPCGKPLAPQALLFDEGYHSHTFYQFNKMESWISDAKVIIFVGTSFAVNITSVVLDHARDNGLMVYNFNVDGGDLLESTARLNAVNIVGDVSKTLPELWSACSFIEKEPMFMEI